MNTKTSNQSKHVQLTRDQILRASSDLIVSYEDLVSNADNPLSQIAYLLPQLQRHPFVIDDGSVDDAVYAAISHHAENSLIRAESGLNAVAGLLEIIGCTKDDGLNNRQTMNLSCLLDMVADNLTTSRELVVGADRVMAVRKIARLQVERKTQGRAE